MVEVQELTMRRAELAEKKLVEITVVVKMSIIIIGLGGIIFHGFEAASPSIDAWIKTPTNGQTLMTPSVTRGGNSKRAWLDQNAAQKSRREIESLCNSIDADAPS